MLDIATSVASLMVIAVEHRARGSDVKSEIS